MKYLRIGEVAKRFGVSSFFLKKLEEKGLITPMKTWTGKRYFREEDLQTIEEIIFRKREGDGKKNPQFN